MPWQTVRSILERLDRRLEGTDIDQTFKKFVSGVVTPHYQRYGWANNGSHVERLLSVNILSLACRSRLENCTDKAREMFRRWLSDKSYFLHPDTRALVLSQGVEGLGVRDSRDWQTVFERYLVETRASEKQDLIGALARVQDKDTLATFVKYVNNRTLVRDQDYFIALGEVSRNPAGNSLVWSFIRENWVSLVERFGLNNRQLGRLTKTVVEKFSTEEQLTDVKAFFRAQPEAGAGERARRQALESVENNIQWMESHYTTLAKWLQRETRG